MGLTVGELEKALEGFRHVSVRKLGRSWEVRVNFGRRYGGYDLDSVIELVLREERLPATLPRTL